MFITTAAKAAQKEVKAPVLLLAVAKARRIAAEKTTYAPTRWAA
jgi:hypothetical protein